MKTLTVLDARAAFVDEGSEPMHASVAGDVPAVFGTVTSQLHALRDWLKAQGVRSVANGCHGCVGGWPGATGCRCTAFSKRPAWMCRWATAGKRATCLDARPTCRTRGGASRCTYARPAARGLRATGRHPSAAGLFAASRRSRCQRREQHMQIALERMNIKLHDMISSLAGMSGLAVVRAIVADERSPEAPLALCDQQIRSAKAEPG